MAKFAQVGYGSQGQGLGSNPDGYTYIVNDNVRTGDKIQVVSTSSLGKKFGTTAVPLKTFSENSAKGQKAKVNILSKKDTEVAKMLDESVSGGFITQKDLDSLTQGKITRAYSGGELNISRKGMTQKEYQQAVRGGNIQKYVSQSKAIGGKPELTKNATAEKDTFDSYSKNFMDKGEQK